MFVLIFLVATTSFEYTETLFEFVVTLFFLFEHVGALLPVRGDRLWGFGDQHVKPIRTSG